MITKKEGKRRRQEDLAGKDGEDVSNRGRANDCRRRAWRKTLQNLNKSASDGRTVLQPRPGGAAIWASRRSDNGQPAAP